MNCQSLVLLAACALCARLAFAYEPVAGGAQQQPPATAAGITFRDSLSRAGYPSVAVSRATIGGAERPLEFQPQPQQQQRQAENNVKRILFKELDPDGNTVKPLNSDSWRRMKVEQLIEELSNSMYSPPSSTPPPLLPVRATYAQLQQLNNAGEPLASVWAALGRDTRRARDDLQQQQLWQSPDDQSSELLVPTTQFRARQQPRNSLHEPALNQRAGPAKIRKSGGQFIGAVWAPSGRSSGGGGTTNSAGAKQMPYFSDGLGSSASARSALYGPPSVSLGSGAGGVNSMSPLGPTIIAYSARGHHRAGTEEVPVHMPLHHKNLLGVSSDLESKRTENTRWNNLRGMWGKRSISAASASAAKEGDRFGQFVAQVDEARNLLRTYAGELQARQQAALAQTTTNSDSGELGAGRSIKPM